MRKKIEKLKIMIDEENYPYFEDYELIERLEHNDNLNNLAKELCIIKSGIQEIEIGDIKIPSPKQHFLMLASKYRQNQTGTMVGRLDER